ncbi:MAG: HDIG domain-containing protein [Chloroflexi bacterium]|nr:HDIG domain-containing protein [Chloroflexota bacterium]
MARRFSLAYLRHGAWLRRSVQGGSVADMLRLLLFGVVLTLLVSLAIGLRWSATPRYQAGEVATTTVKAPRTTTFTSEVLTEAARRDAAQDPSTIQLRLEPAVAEDQARRLAEALNDITRIRHDTTLSISQRLERLRALTATPLTEDQINALLNLDDGEWNTVVAETRAVLRRALERQVIADEVGATRERLRDWIRPALSDVQRNLAVALASPFVRANVVVDGPATERNRQRARDEVQPVRVTVQRGEVVIRDGAIVSALDVEKLEQLGLRDRTTTVPELLGIAALIGTLTALLLTYVVLFQPTIWRGRTMLLVGMVIVGTVVGARLVFPLHPLAPYAFPVATAAMVLAVLLDAHLAVIVGAYLALALGLVGDSSLELALLAFAMCIGGAFIMWRADRTARFLTAGLIVALLSLVVTLGFRLTSQALDVGDLAQVAVLSAVNGALAAGLTFVAFSLLGSLFGITTVLQLLELAHPNQPVLRRLAREAPGTYHHSIVVSSLAEAAAEQIGADPLFTRVAVYYHDIGKVMRPYFFVENQANIDNVHDSLDPKTSAQIIIGHVADGVALARRHRLPNRIVDIIREHHGTTQVRYFLHKANEMAIDVDVTDYTYPGPRPQSKESGIIMLADAVEATVRSQFQSGKLLAEADEIPGDDVGVAVTRDDQIGQIVNRIVNERLVEGQLDECGLTLQDLNRIRSAFTTVLTSIYHPRIDYPAARRAAAVP